MGYGPALSRIASGGIGAAPGAHAPAKPGIGVPPAQAHIAPAPYDVAMDPGWKGIVDPNDHELRNILNEMEPEARQVLQQRIQQVLTALKPGAVPPGVPPDAQQAMGVPGMGAPGISTRPVMPGPGPGALPPGI